MDINKIITICAFCAIFGVEFVLSLPTFFNEHVHIKVHIPHEVSSEKEILKSKHQVIHHAPKHKIINHYHSPQRPVKTLHIEEKAPLLENLYLAELDKPQIYEHSYHNAHDPQHREETFLVVEQDHHVKPVEEVYIIKVIEEYGKNHEESIKLIQSAKDHYNQDHDQHEETVKFAEEKPQYHYHHEENSVNYEHHKPKVEAIKEIEGPKFTSSSQEYDHHYFHEPQVEDVMEEYQNDHDYHRPLTETVKIADITNTKKQYQSHYDYQQSTEPTILKSQEEYHHYQTDPTTNYHYSHQPEISIKEHVEYEKPTSYHYSQHTSTSASLKPTHQYAVYEEQLYDNKYKYETNYKKLLPSSETAKVLNGSQKVYQKQNTLYEDFNSNAVENPHAPETYRGHNSYSAAHVQGLGSGGYH